MKNQQHLLTPSVCLILSIMSCPSNSFIHPISSFTRNAHATISTTTQVPTKATREDTDTTFQAFADSLDEDDLFSDDESTSESSSTSSSVYDKEPTWQESLESFLNPTTPIAKKQVLFSDLINANDRIRQDVETAIKDRNVSSFIGFCIYYFPLKLPIRIFPLYFSCSFLLSFSS